MPSPIGFVYFMANDYMPEIFKIGCTERAPSQRADELSAPTGVPFPFNVLCYIEARDFQRVEQELHARLRDYRTAPNREFFDMDCIELAAAALYFHPNKVAFSGTELSTILWERSAGAVSGPHQLRDPYRSNVVALHA